MCAAGDDDVDGRSRFMEGYADPVFVRPFEQSHHCKVDASYMKTSDDLYDRLHHPKSGEEFDVLSPSSDIAQAIIDDGLAAPLDSALVKNRNTTDKLRSPLVRDKQAYGVPFMWGPNLLLYDEAAFAQSPPSSWSVLWNPKYRGRIAIWDDVSTIYMTAQLLGCESHSSTCGYPAPVAPDPTVLFNLGPTQLELVKAKLLALMPRQWSTASELTNLFENHEVIAAMGWPLITNQLRKSGFPARDLVPKERTTGWIDYLMIPNASHNKTLAREFLEYLLEPETQRWVAEVTGYAPVDNTATTVQQFTADERVALHLDDKNSQEYVYLWQVLPARAEYTKVWNDVKESWAIQANEREARAK